MSASKTQPRERISQAIANLCRRKGSNGLKPADLAHATAKELNAIAALGEAWTKLASDEMETRADAMWISVEQANMANLLEAARRIAARQPERVT